MFRMYLLGYFVVLFLLSLTLQLHDAMLNLRKCHIAESVADLK